MPPLLTRGFNNHYTTPRGLNQLELFIKLIIISNYHLRAIDTLITVLF